MVENALAPAKHKTTETTGLAVREAESTELATSAATAAAQAEIQAAIIVARNFPRDESEAFAKLMRSCGRSTFAEGVEYSFPRGGARVSGPSVKLAREAARVWGNIRHGLQIIREDEESRQIRGFAWDLETNTKVEAEMEFKKLIYRKKDGWVKPDERDLRELTHRHAAILIRNCLLQLLPPDLVEDAINESRMTLSQHSRQDPDGARKKVIRAFETLGIKPKMLARYLGHSVDEMTPDETDELRGVFTSIRDGNSKWGDYIEQAEAEPETSTIDPEKLKATEREPIASKAAHERDPSWPPSNSTGAEAWLGDNWKGSKTPITKAFVTAGLIAKGKSWYDVEDRHPWPHVLVVLEKAKEKAP